MKKIFITGGTGFIGNHVLEKLKDLDIYEIVVMSRKEHINRENITFIKGDICNYELLNTVVPQSDYVIHMAGCKNDEKSFSRVNVDGVKNIVNVCKEHASLKKFIYLSSVGVIGSAGDVIVNEKTVCCPENEYETSKYQGEIVVRNYSKDNPGKVVILRPTNVFGENDPESHLLNLMISLRNQRFRFVGNNENDYYLNYIYVKEISEIIERFLEINTDNDVYILNTPINLKVFIVTLKKLLGNETRTRNLPYWSVLPLARFFDRVPNKILKRKPFNTKKLCELTNMKRYSPSLLKKDLNWSPTYGIDEALGNLIINYRENGLLA